MKMIMPGLGAVAAAETAFAALPAAPSALAADRWAALADAAAKCEAAPEATVVVDFWREAGPARWFGKNAGFDKEFRDAFLPLHELAAVGVLPAWPLTPTGALALVILLDQFPRNAFRGTPRMYATDAAAREAAASAIDARHDRAVEEALRLFFYLPFGHSEELADQERSVLLARGLGEPALSHAKGHYDIIRRFGRFPHRNLILDRAMTAEEQSYLDTGGFAG